MDLGYNKLLEKAEVASMTFQEIFPLLMFFVGTFVGAGIALINFWLGTKR